ncbi:hypothetical protein WV31_19350 [Magnetospirillum sp. ME-1]|uniref:hypothetical protein n=1 Tax=Magnetospirillum sp. ME-1 TaxID=1639348 RepID=UPI000A17CBB5|nr:hypothetical protein [Magnetospirillum sp. ME-1]ARJ67656.1 hypothetical protein WV31_19350 [Magnetospirillum sp. ME-1]
MSDAPSIPPVAACAEAVGDAARVIAQTEIAQTMAMAVQDASDHLRDAFAVALAAQGSLLARLVKTGSTDGADTLAAIQLVVDQAQANLERVTTLARQVLGGMR